MKFISSDTNIWLDFHTISQIELPFRLPYTYIMYNEALREEIIDPPELLVELQGNGLIGVDITIEEFTCALALGNKYVKLSGYDRIALAIAKTRNIPLLSGDNPLRKAAAKEGVEVFGTIGILDRLYKSGLISKLEYNFCLESFLEHAERRLPVEEIQKRLDSLQ